MWVILDTCNNNNKQTRRAALIAINPCHTATGALKTIFKLHIIPVANYRNYRLNGTSIITDITEICPWLDCRKAITLRFLA